MNTEEKADLGVLMVYVNEITAWLKKRGHGTAATTAIALRYELEAILQGQQ